jgi:ketosteroid isomerase-like protein
MQAHGLLERVISPEDFAMSHDPAAVACALYAAFARQDRAAMDALLAKDFHFTSPLDNALDRATYFERCWPNSDNIRDFSFVHVVPTGDQVFVTYVGTNEDGHRFRNTELLTVRGGQVVDVEVYFGWSLPHPAPPGGFVDEA